jgi:hypothetical protein
VAVTRLLCLGAGVRLAQGQDVAVRQAPPLASAAGRRSNIGSSTPQPWPSTRGCRGSVLIRIGTIVGTYDVSKGSNCVHCTWRQTFTMAFAAHQTSTKSAAQRVLSPSNLNTYVLFGHPCCRHATPAGAVAAAAMPHVAAQANLAGSL